MLKDKTGKFFCPTCPDPLVDKEKSDCYSLEEAVRHAVERYGPDYHSKCDIIEASVTDYFRFIGRRGGRVSSKRKTDAVRLNGSIRHKNASKAIEKVVQSIVLKEMTKYERSLHALPSATVLRVSAESPGEPGEVPSEA